MRPANYQVCAASGSGRVNETRKLDRFALGLPTVSFASDRNHPISTKRPNDETRDGKTCSVPVSGLHIVRRIRSELESTFAPRFESTGAYSPLGERSAGSEGRRARRHS